MLDGVTLIDERNYCWATEANFALFAFFAVKSFFSSLLLGCGFAAL